MSGEVFGELLEIVKRKNVIQYESFPHIHRLTLLIFLTKDNISLQICKYSYSTGIEWHRKANKKIAIGNLNDVISYLKVIVRYKLTYMQ